jgi:hypothetical protein
MKWYKRANDIDDVFNVNEQGKRDKRKKIVNVVGELAKPLVGYKDYDIVDRNERIFSVEQYVEFVSRVSDEILERGAKGIEGKYAEFVDADFKSDNLVMLRIVVQEVLYNIEREFEKISGVDEGLDIGIAEMVRSKFSFLSGYQLPDRTISEEEADGVIQMLFGFIQNGKLCSDLHECKWELINSLDVDPKALREEISWSGTNHTSLVRFYREFRDALESVFYEVC